jgi:two-component SAPR family response regulator
MTVAAEQQAIRLDAATRLDELRAVAQSLWPDRDDPHVSSELTVVMGQIRQAEQALNNRDVVA